MSRRDKNDEQWKLTRASVFTRDNMSCRLLRVITPQEAIILKKNAGKALLTLDPAHVVAVSIAPHMCYDVDNIVALNRYSHSMLENSFNPITGDRIAAEDEENWWKRIIGDELFTKLTSRRYKQDSSYIV